MSEAKPQDCCTIKGATVKDYRTLSYGETGKMNQFKELSRQFTALLQQHGMDMSNDPSLQNSQERWDSNEWLREAHKDLQRACMAACRAIARPESDC